MYINTDDVVAHDYFWKEYLRRMHEYRDAVAHAKFEGNGRGLQKFKNMIFMTYDGPGLPGYDNKCVRVSPQTGLRKILKVEAAMTGQQKAQYEADETTTDAHSGQRTKVGLWQDRGLKYADRCNLFAQGKLTQEAMDICWREGVFYNVKTCTPREIETVRAFAAKHDLAIMEMADSSRRYSTGRPS